VLRDARIGRSQNAVAILSGRFVNRKRASHYKWLLDRESTGLQFLSVSDEAERLYKTFYRFGTTAYKRNATTIEQLYQYWCVAGEVFRP